MGKDDVRHDHNDVVRFRSGQLHLRDGAGVVAARQEKGLKMGPGTTITDHLIYADWLDERGDRACESWRMGSEQIYTGYHIGIGIGRGSGIGSGVGIGSGMGIGTGTGSGMGIGSGGGRGFYATNKTGHPMEPNKAYLFHCGDWHTYVGRMVRQVSPLLYEITESSKISDTNNDDCWHELCAGNEELRKAATYVHDQTPRFVPASISVSEWVGKTPKEQGL